MWKIFLAVIPFFFVACNDSKIALYDRVQKNWDYAYVIDEQGSDFKKLSPTDALSLTVDNGKNDFKYDIEAENIHASGTWELRNDTLVFTYNPKPADPDTLKRSVRFFKITKCTGSELVFTENGITFAFSHYTGHP